MSRFVEFNSEYPKDKHGKLVGWVNHIDIDEWPIQPGQTILFRDPLSKHIIRGRLIEKYKTGVAPTFYVRAEEIKD